MDFLIIKERKEYELSTIIEEVERRVKEKIKGNETITVYIQTAVKNNGKKRKGITVSEKGIHISPTIYLEEYFQQFQEGKPIEKIVEKISSTLWGS